MLGEFAEGESSPVNKRKTPPTRPISSEARDVRPRLCTTPQDQNVTVNYEEKQLAYRYKVLVHLPPELDIFRRTLQDIVDLSTGHTDLNQTIAQDIVDKLGSLDVDHRRIATVSRLLQVSVDEIMLKQIGSRTSTTQDLLDGIILMTDAFISSQGNPAPVGREEIFTGLVYKDSAQHQNPIALPEKLQETYHSTRLGHTAQGLGNLQQDVALAAIGRPKNSSPADSSSKDEKVLSSMSLGISDSKQNEGTSVKRPPLEGSAKNASTTVSTETADVLSATSEPGARPPPFADYAVREDQRKISVRDQIEKAS
ncbi:MAG: hypothetical protein Q9165_007007 [Trypethelium subeluteriae]